MNVQNHLSQLESAGLVNLTQVSPDVEYLFRHTLVQEAAYASLLDEDLSELHRLVGEAIETLYPEKLDEMAASLGRHFEAAGDPRKAAGYFQRAGRRALGAYAHHEAAEHFQNALRLSKNEAQQADLLTGLGESQAMMGHHNEAIQTWKDGIELYRQLNDLANTAYLYARAGRTAWFTGEPQLGLDLCQEGMRVTKEAPESHGLALLLHETGRAYFFNSNYDEALPLCKKALAMAKRVGSDSVQAESLTTLGLLPQVPPEERLSLLKQAVELAESAGMLHVASRAHLNLGSAYYMQFGDAQKAIQHYRYAATLANRCGVIQSELYYLTAAAQMSLDVGDLDETERILAEMETLAEKLPANNASKYELKVLKLLPGAYRGNWEAAINAAKEQYQNAQSAGNIAQLMESGLGIVNASLELLRLGRQPELEEFYLYLRELEEYAQNDEATHYRTWIQLGHALLAAYQSRFDTAHQHLERAEALSTDFHFKSKRCHLVGAALEVAYLEKDWAAGIDTFKQLEQDHKGLNAFDWARVLLITSDIYISRGESDDLERAQALLQEASQVYTKMDSPIYLDEVEKLLKASRAQTFAQAAAQRMVAQELAQAGRLQSSFLPEEPPSLPGWQIAANLQPARQTSGDFYDFINLPGGKLGFAIADVADKGIGAALFMTSSRTLLRAYVEENVDAPENVLQITNQRITQDTHDGLFITLFYGVLDPTSGELVYCNAGHNPPYLIAPGGRCQDLPKTGIPLGIFPGTTWQTRKVLLEPGSLLALYTDGLTEASGSDEKLYGAERLLDVLQNHSGDASANDILSAVLEDVTAFRARAPQTDDLAVVILKREILEAPAV